MPNERAALPVAIETLTYTHSCYISKWVVYARSEWIAALAGFLLRANPSVADAQQMHSSNVAMTMTKKYIGCALNVAE